VTGEAAPWLPCWTPPHLLGHAASTGAIAASCSSPCSAAVAGAICTGSSCHHSRQVAASSCRAADAALASQHPQRHPPKLRNMFTSSVQRSSATVYPTRKQQFQAVCFAVLIRGSDVMCSCRHKFVLNHCYDQEAVRGVSSSEAVLHLIRGSTPTRTLGHQAKGRLSIYSQIAPPCRQIADSVMLQVESACSLRPHNHDARVAPACLPVAGEL
jgi:hypothetical protein